MTKLQRTREARPELTQFMRSTCARGIRSIACVKRQSNVESSFFSCEQTVRPTKEAPRGTGFGGRIENLIAPPRLEFRRERRKRRDLQKNPKSLSRARARTGMPAMSRETQRLGRTNRRMLASSLKSSGSAPAGVFAFSVVSLIATMRVRDQEFCATARVGRSRPCDHSSTRVAR